MEVYLDNNATTKPYDEVVSEMNIYLKQKYANPSSIHFMGEELENLIEEKRKTILELMKTNEHKLIFTSSATEANNLAILGYCLNLNKEDVIITSKIEHPSVYNVFKHLEKLGYNVHFLDVDEQGFVKIEELEKFKTIKFASIMHVNNEIGTIEPIDKIAKIVHEKQGIIHVDDCQGFTKADLDYSKLDLITINGHKIHGPKGVGALIFKKSIKLKPIIYGGQQEQGLRPSTYNVPAIMGFAKAIEISMKNKEKNEQKVYGLRNKLAQSLLEINESFVNGPDFLDKKKRIYNNLNIRFRGVEAEAILMRLSLQGICISAGSACSSRSLKPSRILVSLGLEFEQVHGSVRLSPSIFNTDEEIDYTVEVMKKTIKDLRELSSVY